LFLSATTAPFLDNVVTQVIAAEGDGRWGEYAGGYADWQRVQAARAEEAARVRCDARSAASARQAARRRGQGPQSGGQAVLQRKARARGLPDRIAALETSRPRSMRAWPTRRCTSSAPQEVAQIKARLEALEGEIEAAMLRWEELESRAASA
jgi:ATP-binding cassette subfamily F protein uup